MNGRSLIVHHLVRQGDGRAADERALFVSALQKVGQQFPFALDEDGPPPHKAEVVLLQDVVAFLHHLGAEKGANACRGHGLAWKLANNNCHNFTESGGSTWMFPMTPVDSIRLATLTVLPQMS